MAYICSSETAGSELHRSEPAVSNEVKRQEKNIDLAVLRSKADAFLRSTKRFAGYDISYRSLSIEDM